MDFWLIVQFWPACFVRINDYAFSFQSDKTRMDFVDFENQSGRYSRIFYTHEPETLVHFSRNSSLAISDTKRSCTGILLSLAGDCPRTLRSIKEPA